MKTYLHQQSHNTLNWFLLAFSLKGSVIPKIWFRVFLSALFALLIVVIDAKGIFNVQVPILASVIPNIVIGLLLVFRTNTAYDRFWEGRRIWGSIINTSRSLARQVIVHIPKSKQGGILELIKEIPFEIKNHLRTQNPTKNIPYKKTLNLENKIAATASHPVIFQSMQLHITELSNSIGGCERILKTPIPLAYGIHLKQLLLIYNLTLPFQFVGELGWYSVIIVAIISFTLFGIEEIGIEIENPFGTDKNDLPLDTICETIKKNIESLQS
jgi:ion channel-forming bestrophin family protein